MIVQRKLEVLWEDVEIPTPAPEHVLEWLTTLPDAVGTEYRICDLVSTAIMRERNNPTRYVGWKQDSE